MLFDTHAHYDDEVFQNSLDTLIPEMEKAGVKKIITCGCNLKSSMNAIKLAEKGVAAGKGGPFGAVIVKNGKIVARGCNQVTSTNDPTRHAEVDAIRKACKKLNSFDLKDCIIYSSCEPCPMCLGAIYWARPNALYFAADRIIAAKHGFDDNFIYNLNCQNLFFTRIGNFFG